MKKIEINIVDMLNYSIRKVMNILTTSKINDSRRQVKLQKTVKFPIESGNYLNTIQAFYLNIRVVYLICFSLKFKIVLFCVRPLLNL